MISPILPSNWTAQIHDAMAAFPAGRDFVLTNWDGKDPRGTNALGVLANHPDLARAFLGFNNHVATRASLPRRTCELLILRTCWLCRSEYEYVQHRVLGRRAGLTAEELARIDVGPDADGWGPIDADLLRAVDEIVQQSRIKDSTWSRLSEHFDIRQQMDIPFVVGCYQVLSTAFNSFGLCLEGDLSKDDLEVIERMRTS